MAAIFLIVVLAALGTYVITVTSVQERTSSWGLEGARAFHAARSALQWGAYRALSDGACWSGTHNISYSVQGLQGFTTEVTCSSSDHRERNATVRVFVITAEAARGQFGDTDFVRRQLQIKLSESPP